MQLTEALMQKAGRNDESKFRQVKGKVFDGQDHFGAHCRSLKKKEKKNICFSLTQENGGKSSNPFMMTMVKQKENSLSI